MIVVIRSYCKSHGYRVICVYQFQNYFELTRLFGVYFLRPIKSTSLRVSTTLIVPDYVCLDYLLIVTRLLSMSIRTYKVQVS